MGEKRCVNCGQTRGQHRYGAFCRPPAARHLMWSSPTAPPSDSEDAAGPTPMTDDETLRMVNQLDAVVDALGIAESDVEPADEIRALIAQNEQLHAEVTRLRASGTADERLRATEPEPGGTYRPVRDDNGWGQLRMEYVPPYVPSEEQTTRLLNTLSKAWPVLAEHANWMDGTFDLALTDLRNDVAALHKAVARLRASLPSEREGQR